MMFRTMEQTRLQRHQHLNMIAHTSTKTGDCMNKKYLVTTLVENKCFPVAPTAFCTKVSAEADHPDTYSLHKTLT